MKTGLDIPRSAAADLPPGIAGLTEDSREVRPGFLFAALPGEFSDGRDFICDAIARGATVVLAETGTALPDGAGQIRLIEDPQPRRRFARMAAAFHGAQPDTVVAVTGTNGKTSVVNLARQIWTRLGLRAASLGTLGLTTAEGRRPGRLTTPQSAALHADLAAVARDGVTHLAMEASSHGLDQHRLDGVGLRAAAFTNLGRDHLDYHKTVEAYFLAKARLFDELLPPGGTAVLNADAKEGQALVERCRRRGQRVVTFGRQGRELRLDDVQPRADGLDLSLTVFGAAHRVRLPLAGLFQAENALCALGLVLAGEDVAADAAVAALEHLTGVPGRLELAARRASGAPVFVDYAHTPDALAALLTALRAHTRGRLVVVFGCGGDRDPGKRPEMGAVVRRLADIAIVTDDNPRSEDPAAIRAQVAAGCPGATEIGDRAAAIRTAVAGLTAGDVLVVAGKGHETGQTIGREVHPFDDAEQVRTAVAALDGGAP
jgi:UDP-N-acetylmuramoyl-L-alanyl-D-glutamate--2,6-diaminopimelate ligase